MIFYVFNHGLLLQAHYAAAKLNQFLSKKKQKYYARARY